MTTTYLCFGYPLCSAKIPTGYDTIIGQKVKIIRSNYQDRSLLKFSNGGWHSTVDTWRRTQHHTLANDYQVCKHMTSLSTIKPSEFEFLALAPTPCTRLFLFCAFSFVFWTLQWYLRKFRGITVIVKCFRVFWIESITVKTATMELVILSYTTSIVHTCLVLFVITCYVRYRCWMIYG